MLAMTNRGARATCDRCGAREELRRSGRRIVDPSDGHRRDEWLCRRCASEDAPQAPSRGPKTPDAVAFSQRLRRLMAARGMNGLDLERESGLSRQSIYRWMHAESYPYIPALYVLRETLGCTWADLLGEDGS